VVFFISSNISLDGVKNYATKYVKSKGAYFKLKTISYLDYKTLQTFVPTSNSF